MGKFINEIELGIKKNDCIKLVKKTFIRFLKENRCYHKYINELKFFNKHYRTIDNQYTIDFIIDKCIENNINIIKASFSNTIYWEKMSNKWMKIYNKYFVWMSI